VSDQSKVLKTVLVVAIMFAAILPLGLIILLSQYGTDEKSLSLICQHECTPKKSHYIISEYDDGTRLASCTCEDK